MISTGEAVLNVAGLIGTAGAAMPLLQAGKVAARQIGKRSLSAAEKQAMKARIRTHLDDALQRMKPKERDVYQELAQKGVNDADQVAELLVKAFEDGEFDWHSLVPTAADLDPTGFLSVIRSFNKPVCQ